MHKLGKWDSRPTLAIIARTTKEDFDLVNQLQITIGPCGDFPLRHEVILELHKSGKKFAPKAPVRRAAPAPSAPPRAPSRRASVASQTSASHPPVVPSETATPEPPPQISIVELPAPSELAITGSSSVAPSVEHAPKDKPTAIPIPVPQRKTSVAVPIPQPTKSVSTSSQALPSSTIATTESVSEVSTRKDKTGEVAVAQSEAGQNEGSAVTGTVAVHDDEVAPDARPSKRLRTAIESTAATTLVPPVEETSQLVTPPATQTPAQRERTQSRDESEVPRTVRRGSTVKAGGRRVSRSTSKDTGKVQKKERKRRTRKREPTPEGAELIEIAPAVIKMSDLCKDLRTGKKSRRETELRALEQAEAERKKAQQEEGREGTPVKKTPDDTSPKGEENGGTPNKMSQAGPVMRIVNGEIVLDTTSLQVDRHADAERNEGDLEDVIENSLTRKINQSTYGKRSKTESWDEDMTDLFYRGLRMFGTDFMVISKMFPGRSRRQIKLKFNNEERRDPQRIKDTLLGPRESIDINTYSEMTNTVYDDPRIIQQQLDEEKRQIEEQHERDKKAQEDLLRNPDGVAGNDASGLDKAPTKPMRKTKKQVLRDLGGGTEEILGSIDD
ncbi:transcription factor TFIIIB subunit BDP1 [Aspergillus undulatus]|uniref:transcription factor TFIIIB subunit BDP1 n=1 Tax=Aspergillus undulatus TaxID=1810928 RepID=UPI003CCD7E5E